MKVFLILFGLFLLMINFVEINYVNAEITCSDYSEVETIEAYQQDISSVNSWVEGVISENPDVDWSDTSILTPLALLELPEENAECLKNFYGIEPDSVAKLSPEAQEMLVANMDLVLEHIPNLHKYATVPEFEEISIMVLGSAVILVIILARRFSVSQ